MNRRILASLIVLFALTQAIAPAFSYLTGLGVDISQQTTQDVVRYPEIPAGYAFSIWSVIFVYALIYAFNALRFRSQDEQVYDAIGWLSIGIFATGTAWMICDQLLGGGWYLVVLIIAMWGMSVTAFFKALGLSVPTGFFRRVVIPMLGLYTGWLSVAVFLNIGTETRFWFLDTFHITSLEFSILPIIPAMAVCFWLIAKTRGNLWVGFPVLWALVGIIVTNARYFPDEFMLPLAIGLLISVGGMLYFARRQPEFSH